MKIAEKLFTASVNVTNGFEESYLLVTEPKQYIPEALSDLLEKIHNDCATANMKDIKVTEYVMSKIESVNINDYAFGEV